MTRIRLILAAVALGALTLVPGALATTGGIFTANDPGFGSVVIGNTAGPTTVTITNSDPTTHTIDSLSLAGTNPGQFNLVSDTCSAAVLAQNDTCTVGVNFAPTTPAGAKDAQIDVNYDTGSTQTNVSALAGTATAAAPAVTVNDIAFGNVQVGGTSTRTLTVTNTGNAPLNITTTGKSGGNVFTLSNNNCAQSTVAAGNSCTISVTFSPTAAQAYASVVTITDDAPNSPQQANLSGNGLSQFVTFTPQPFNFPQAPVGQAGTPVTFTLHNQDNVGLQIPAAAFTKVSGNVGAFKISADTCSGTTVAANGTCTFAVAYTATAGGNQSVAINVADSAADSPQTLTLTGSGKSPAAFTNVRGAVGCTTATLQWTVPAGVAGSWIVRNSNHVPVNQHDGTRIRATGHGVRQEKGLKQFHTYHYAIWAQYKYPGFNPVVYSAPKRLNLKTGRVCSPQRGAHLTGTAPLIDWSPAAGVWGYGLRLFDHGRAVFSWSARTTVSAHKVPAGRLKHGHSYQVFIYAYSNAHPRGISIGSSSFSIK